MKQEEIDHIVDEEFSGLSPEELEQLRQKVDNLSEENKGMVNDLEEDDLSRRSFLKALGLGVGGLALSSSAAGWSLFRPKSQGTSDIDAETVDAVQASKLGRDVARDVSGDAVMTKAGSNSVTTSSKGNTLTTKITTMEKAVFDSVTGYVDAGTGQVTLRRNGNIISSGNVSSQSSLTTIGTPRTNSPTWTLSANFNTLSGGGKTTVSDYFSTFTITVTSNMSRTTLTTVLSDQGSELFAELHFRGSNAQARILVNGSTKTSSMDFNTGITISTTTTGSFDSPKISFIGTPYTDDTMRIYTRSANLYTTVNGSGKATLTAYRNRFFDMR